MSFWNVMGLLIIAVLAVGFYKVFSRYLMKRLAVQREQEIQSDTRSLAELRAKKAIIKEEMEIEPTPERAVLLKDIEEGERKLSAWIYDDKENLYELKKEIKNDRGFCSKLSPLKQSSESLRGTHRVCAGLFCLGKTVLQIFIVN
ncbi:MAG: hypothetical protein ACRCZE_01525 [Candidatus Altimarinota bacterium]